MGFSNVGSALGDYKQSSDVGNALNSLSDLSSTGGYSEQGKQGNEGETRMLQQEQVDSGFPSNEVQDLDSFILSQDTTSTANAADEMTNAFISAISGRAIDLGSLSGSDLQNITTTAGSLTTPNNAQDPLVITASDTKLMCGEDGSIDNSCTFSGGQNQIVVGGDASNVLIMGITFTGSISAAVVSSGSESSDVTVKQCNFMVSGNPIELDWFPESDNEIFFINDNSHSCFVCGLLAGMAFRVILVMLV
jgi:hypothetical protein